MQQTVKNACDALLYEESGASNVSIQQQALTRWGETLNIEQTALTESTPSPIDTTDPKNSRMKQM